MRTCRIIFFSVLFSYFFDSAHGQNFIWARQINAYSHNAYPSVLNVADDAGNAYVTAAFTDSVRFGATAYYTSGDSKSYLARFDAMGNVVWTRVFPGWSSSMSIDPNNNIYVLGTFSGTATFGSTTVTADLGIASTFLVKYNSAGTFLWVKIIYGNFSTSSTIFFSKIICDHAGNIMLSSNVMGTVAVDTFTINGGSGRTFICKMNSSGHVMWLNRIKTNAYEIQATHLQADLNNNVIAAGYFGRSDFGPPSFSCIMGQDTLYSQGYTDIFMAAYDSNGNLKWAKQIGGAGYDGMTGLNTDRTGNSCLFGAIGYNQGSFPAYQPFILKLDSSGNQLWQKNTTTTLGFLAGDLEGNNYCKMYSMDTLIYDSDTLFSSTQQWQICKIDSSGNLIWHKKLDTGNSFSVSPGIHGELFLSGSKDYGRYPLRFDNNQLYEGTRMFDFIALLHDTDYIPSVNNTISGNVFDDDNNNCIQDTIENNLGGYSVVALPGPYFSQTDSAGNYLLRTDTGNFTVHQIIPSSHGFTFSEQCPPGNSYTVSIPSTNTNVTGYDFADNYSACELLTVDLGGAERFILCYTTKGTEINICNHGRDTAYNVQLLVQYPGRLAPLTGNIPWTSYSVTDSLMTFDFPSIVPDSCIHILITDTLDCDTMSMNDYYRDYVYSAYLTPLNSCYLNDSVYNRDTKVEHYFFVVSTQNYPKAKEIKVYPNPAHDELRVDINLNSEDAIYSICDITGKTVVKKRLTATDRPSVNIGNLAPGFYVFNLERGHNLFHAKFIKQ